MNPNYVNWTPQEFTSAEDANNAAPPKHGTLSSSYLVMAPNQTYNNAKNIVDNLGPKYGSNSRHFAQNQMNRTSSTVSNTVPRYCQAQNKNNKVSVITQNPNSSTCQNQENRFLSYQHKKFDRFFKRS